MSVMRYSVQRWRTLLSRRYCTDASKAKNSVEKEVGDAIPKPKVLTGKEREAALAAEEGAKIATAFMFPWERRALSGEKGKLSTWEKLYWVFFAGAMCYLGFKMVTNKKDLDGDNGDNEEQNRILELRKKKAMALLKGNSLIGGADDPFEGLAPEEIDAFVREETKHTLPPELYHRLPDLKEEDEFEGMSPEEINAYMQKQSALGTNPVKK